MSSQFSIPVQSQVSISGTGLTAISVPAGTFTCVTGVVQPRAQIGIPFAGQFLLVDAQSGRQLAALIPDQVNLAGLVGQSATVCGTSQGEIEGLTTLRVASAAPATTQTPNLQLAQLLLQLILSNPSLLMQLISALQSPFGALGLASSGIGALGGPQAALNLGLAQTGVGAAAGFAGAASALGAGGFGQGGFAPGGFGAGGFAPGGFGSGGFGGAGSPFGGNPLAGLGSANPLAALGSANPLAALGSANPLAALGSANPLAALGNANPLAALGNPNPLAGFGQSPFGQQGGTSQANVAGIPMPQTVGGVGSF